MRGRVCILRLFLGLARAVTLGSESGRTHDHILLTHLWLFQLGGPGPRIYILQKPGCPETPGAEFPLRRILRLAGLLEWRYSKPPLQGFNHFLS
jgi:hypothetical protein